MLEEVCADIIPDNAEEELTKWLLKDAGMNARQGHEDVYAAYRVILEEYTYTENIDTLNKRMDKYWEDVNK